MCACQPLGHAVTVTAESGPKDGGNINLVVEFVVLAGLRSSDYKTFNDIIIVDAVLLQDTLDAALHFLPAATVERHRLWNDVCQGEG